MASKPARNAKPASAPQPEPPAQEERKLVIWGGNIAHIKPELTKNGEEYLSVVVRYIGESPTEMCEMDDEDQVLCGLFWPDGTIAYGNGKGRSHQVGDLVLFAAADLVKSNMMSIDKATGEEKPVYKADLKGFEAQADDFGLQLWAAKQERLELKNPVKPVQSSGLLTRYAEIAKGAIASFVGK